MSQTRRLAAILAADVAGYSRLMGADEEGTLAALKTIRQELSDPKLGALLRLRPNYSLSWARENVPLVGETLERSLEGLRKAGLPEQ